MSVEITLRDFLLMACLVAPAFFAVALAVLCLRKRSRQARRVFPLVAAGLLSVAFNPIAQFFFLEPLDERCGNAMAEQARDADLLGKTQSAVVAALGTPDCEYSRAPDRRTWEYKQVPGYWVGSHFKVFFQDGTVHFFDPNND